MRTLYLAAFLLCGVPACGGQAKPSASEPRPTPQPSVILDVPARSACLRLSKADLMLQSPSPTGPDSRAFDASLEEFNAVTDAKGSTVPELVALVSGEQADLEAVRAWCRANWRP